MVCSKRDLGVRQAKKSVECRKIFHFLKFPEGSGSMVSMGPGLCEFCGYGGCYFALKIVLGCKHMWLESESKFKVENGL